MPGKCELPEPVLGGGIVLCLFAIVEPLFYSCAFLPDHIYFGVSATLSALRTAPGCVAIAISVLLAAATWHLKWEGGDTGKAVRYVVVGCACCLGWTFSTYSFNFVYGQHHVFDRILLVLLAVGVYFRPAVLATFCVVVSIIVGQFDVPLGYSWTDKLPIIETLYLAAFFQLVRRIHSRVTSETLLSAVLMLWAALYLAPGIGKIWLDWLRIDDSGNIIYGACLQNGWLSWLGWPSVANLAAATTDWGFPVRLIVMGIELGAAVLLWHRRLAVTFFVSAIMMHIGILVLTGICFWKWVVIDVVFIVALTRWIPDSLFGHRAAIGGAIFASMFIASSPRDVSLAWLDSQAAYTFQVRAYDESGKAHLLLPEDFAPYDIQFSQGRLYFLTETHRLADCLGAVVSDESLEAIAAAASDEITIKSVREKYGSRQSNPQQERDFHNFLIRFIRAFNEGETGGGHLSPPLHIRSGLPLTTEISRITPGVRIQRIEIYLREFIVDDLAYREIHQELVHTCDASESI